MNALADAPQEAVAPPPWLVTPTLRLREFSASWADRQLLVRMHQESRLRRLLIDDEPLHRHEVADVFLQRLQAFYRRHEGLGIWCAERLVRLLGDSELCDPMVRDLLSAEALAQWSEPRPRFAGWFNLMPMPHAPDELELGARLLPDAWGTGLALEGGEQLLHHAFEQLGAARVWAVCHPQHASVRYCVLSLGFEDQGVMAYGEVPARHYLVAADAWRRHMALPRRDRVRRALHQVRMPQPERAVVEAAA
ncbi:GNAT family N-acetyltransferase [Ideonella sp. BN130291]|uniref:GNAT family N-acetyltransferase n=1 Tax=Ideonella sp. BN130291 TaxID=3112940 RepID=UPI002E2742B9|nr:GNAT family N-acetyltransferase [Ideonella sp. BN130291]